jgi:CRP/FNR family transcriptional regulator, cyclic AMP receptor protein
VEKIDLFAQNGVFSCLGVHERVDLLKQASMCDYLPGQYLTHAGDIWPYLFFISKGTISAIKESLEGRSLVATSFKPGEVFWGITFFHPQMPMPVALVVDTPCTVYTWSRQQMLPIILQNGEFSWELSRLMVSRMLRASEIVEELAFQPVAGRLARLLIDYPGHVGSGPVSRSLTLDNMAARIGSTREMVCRILQRFADDELISITRTEFEITNRDGLTKMMQKERG